MSCLMRLLPLLAAAPLCTAFAPLNPSVSHTSGASPRQHHVLEATNKEISDLDRLGKATGSAFLAFAISFSAVTGPNGETTIPSANAVPSPFDSSITLARSKSASTDEDAAIQYLEEETRQVEKEAKADARKARIEKSRENFFEYEAKMAEQTESRIEAAERKAELEYEADKEQVQTLKALEEKAEKEAAMAQTKKEKAQARKEAKALLAREKEAERKEKRAERAEKVFLAEEQQEQKILLQKENAARAEEEKFEKVEKEYESVAELAKEDEEELKLAKSLLRRK